MSRHSYTQLQALAETFKVLGDTTRVRILDALSRAEVPVCDLAELLDLTQSAVSHQLRLLRGARLVKSRRDGQHIYYTLDDQHIVKLFEQGLEHIQERTMPGQVGADLRVPPPRGYGEARQSAKRDGGRTGPALRQGSGPAHGSAPTRRSRRA